MRKLFTMILLFSICGGFAYSQQDGNNALFGVPKISMGIMGKDTLLPVAGRQVVFVSVNPITGSLDGDNLAEIIIPDYNKGGRVVVFEQVNPNSLEFKMVWSSKTLKPRWTGTTPVGPGSTPQTLVVSDLDNNGKKEIIFTLGRAPKDSILSDTTWPRGLHIYEWDGVIGSNNYGTDPYIVRPEAIDTFIKYHNFGRQHNGGLIVSDVDKDGQQELLIGSGFYDNYFDKDERKNTAKVYVLSLQSGTFKERNAVLKPEYIFYKMAKCLGDTDGYSCSGLNVADIDGDGLNEVVIVGYTIVGPGAGMGFFKSLGKDKYYDGNAFSIANELNQEVFRVHAQMATYRDKTTNKDIVFINTDEASLYPGEQSRLLALSDIDVFDLIGLNNITVLKKGDFGWSGTALGDQDHGQGSDGFDIYFPSVDGEKIFDIEYKGSGNLMDSNNYNTYTIFNAKKVFKIGNGGILQVIIPPGDVNNNGRKEIICNYQIFGDYDTLINGNITVRAVCPFFVIEWGDTVIGTVNVQPLVFITDEDYKLEQNYPNPFNPTTSIKFSLPTADNISLIVYDINGREVRKLIDGKNYEKGSYEATWDGKNDFGKTVASGNYFYKLKWGNFEKSMKMTYLK